MARLVTKFGYMKSGTKKKSGGYARYIATREGVEKLDDSVKKIPATDKQKQLVHQLTDLALLSNGLLKGEALTAFVKRSIEMI